VNRFLSTTTGCVLVCLLLLPAVAAARYPRFPAPPDASIQKMADEMQALGGALDVRRFESGDTIEEVSNFYKQRWKRGPDGDVGYRESLTEKWYVISRMERGYLLAVQIQPNASGGSWGYLSISELPALLEDRAGRSPRSTPFPSMAGSVVLDDMHSDDPGKSGRVVSLANEFSLGGNVTFYRDHYRALGWKADMDLPVESGHSLTYSTRGRTVRIVIQATEQGGAVIVANEVEASR